MITASTNLTPLKRPPSPQQMRTRDQSASFLQRSLEKRSGAGGASIRMPRHISDFLPDEGIRLTLRTPNVLNDRVRHELGSRSTGRPPWKTLNSHFPSQTFIFAPIWCSSSSDLRMRILTSSST